MAAFVFVPYLAYTSFQESTPATRLTCVISGILICAIPSLGPKVAEYVQKRIQAWLFLFYGADMIHDEYSKSKGSPFRIAGPDNDHVFITSKVHIKEMIAARWDQLSFFAATKHMFQPKYTMHGHNWLDERGAEGIGYVKAVSVMLPKQVSKMVPRMYGIVNQEIENAFTNAPKVNEDGSVEVSAYILMKRLACRMNAFCFFGDVLGNDHDFLEALLEYNHLVITGAEALRVTPNFLKWLVGGYFARKQGIQETVFSSIVRAVEQHMEARARIDPQATESEQTNMIEWIIDTAPKHANWDARRITYEIIALWFGSHHALASTNAFALYHLCTEKQYIPALSAEAKDPKRFGNFLETSRGMPLLDSFIKESTRVMPMEAMSGRRQALQDFTFEDGTFVKKGTWTCVPLKAMQHDSQYFPQAAKFNAFRFAYPEVRPVGSTDVEQPEGPSRLSDPSPHYYYWGVGRIVCPGRFYVAISSKLIMANLLQKFELELVDKKARKEFTWRSYILPTEQTLVRLKRQVGSS